MQESLEWVKTQAGKGEEKLNEDFQLMRRTAREHKTSRYGELQLDTKECAEITSWFRILVDLVAVSFSSW